MKKFFGEVFKAYRLKSQISTLAEFGKILAIEEGIFLEDSIFSRWQNNERIPINRNLLLKIAFVFVKKGGILSLDQVNEFFESAGHGFITKKEEELFSPFLKNNLILPFTPGVFKNDNSSILLESFASSTDRESFIDVQINLSHELLYCGLPLAAFNRLSKIEKYINSAEFKNKKTRALNINRLRWIKLRCLSDICKPGEFKKGIMEARKNLSFALENKSEDLGPLYWINAALMRLQVITAKKNTLSKNYVEDCLRMAELAVINTSKNRPAEILVEYIEIAKIALLIEDEKLFYKYFSMALLLIPKLSKGSRYLVSMLWDVKARASLKFKNDTDSALENIRFARSYIDDKYQAINLYISVTEAQALNASGDSKLLYRAAKLQKEAMFIASILENPHQQERIKQNRFFGL